MSAVAILMGEYGSGGFVGPLDALTGNLWAAYALRRLLSSYLGPAFRVVKSGDTTGVDIGFNPDGSLDTTSLATYIVSGSAFIKTFYDQSGAVRDLAQGTTSKQPRIALSGVYDGKLVFDGSDDSMGTSATSSGSNSAFAVAARMQVRNASATYIMLEQPASSDAASGVLLYQITTARDFRSTTNSSNYTDLRFQTTTPDASYGWRADRTQAANNVRVVEFIGATKQSASGDVSIGTAPSGNFSSGAWFLGARNNASNFAPMNISSLFIYESAPSDADMIRVVAQAI